MPSTISTTAITNRGVIKGPRSRTNVCLALSLPPGPPSRIDARRASRHTPRATLVGMTPRPHRRLRGPLSWRLATPVVGLISGALFVVSAHNSEGTDLRPGRFTDLASLVRSDAQQVAGMKSQITSLKAQVTTLSGSVDNRQVQKLNRESASVKAQAGLEPARGPGISVTLSDAPQSTDQDTPDTVDNPNLLLVHQQDIQAVVNAMWKGGATAVTIQGQR